MNTLHMKRVCQLWAEQVSSDPLPKPSPLSEIQKGKQSASSLSSDESGKRSNI